MFAEIITSLGAIGNFVTGKEKEKIEILKSNILQLQNCQKKLSEDWLVFSEIEKILIEKCKTNRVNTSKIKVRKEVEEKMRRTLHYNPSRVKKFIKQ